MDENESGVDNRRKFRIRTYNADAQEMNLEIKEKLRGYTKKIKSTLARQECVDIINGEYAHSYGDRTALNTLAVEMKASLMRPKVVIDYERTAFVHPLGNVRITFDRNIRVRRSHFTFGETPEDELLLPDDTYIMEIKILGAMPLWLTALLSEKKLFSRGFSKYGVKYRADAKEKKLTYALSDKDGQPVDMNYFKDEKE